MGDKTNDAYAMVLVELEAGHSLRTRNEISRFEEVGFVMTISGDAELAVLVKSISVAHLGELIVERIQNTNAVTRTRTYVGLSPIMSQNWPPKEIQPHDVYAIVHIEAGPGSTLHVCDEISKLEAVRFAMAVTGIPDVVCLVETDNLDRLGDLVLDRIEKIKGVELTRTYVSLTPFTPLNWLLPK